jgi:transposase InsO family protein
MHKVRTSWPVETRVRYVVTYDELRKQHPRLTARRFATMIEVPYSTFARWLARFRTEGPRGLMERSRRPRHRPNALPGSVLDIVRAAHRRSGLGVRLLHHVLTAAARIRCSVSSVYRILRRAGALVARPRRPKPVWTRYQKAVPGERAQMDLKYLPQGRFQLTLVDDCSRMVAATVLTRRTSAAVCEALPGLLAALPFPLRCIQTDNGGEFGLALTRLLEAQGIRHARIRPHTPRLNGKVERVQRTMAEELWDHLAPGSLAAWQRQLERYLRFYNQRRPHSALGYQAPLGYARDRLPAGPDVSHMS